MFKKLRNRLLFLNMFSVCLVLLVAFVAIYGITYQQIIEDIKVQLQKTSFQSVPRQGANFGIFNADSYFPTDVMEGEEYNPISIYFWIEVDNENKIIEIFNPAMTNLTEETAITLSTTALSKNNDFGTFRYNGGEWAYQRSYNYLGVRIIFMEVSNHFSTLNSMMISMGLVSVITILFVFFLSKFFADRAIKPVRESYQKQKQFVADASHELKTPLTIINTNIDIVLENEKKSISSQKKWLGYIKEESERMTRLTNHLLDLTSLQEKDSKLLNSEFNLSDLLEELLLQMEASIYEKKLQLIQNIDTGIKMKGNIDQIKQLLMILLDNAIKYCQEKGSITVELHKKDKVILSVSNDSEAIPKNQLPYLFDRFYRVEESRNRKYGGYGLGLAIAKKIVETHLGKIEVKSDEEIGVSFIVTF